jgi:hypothetical protein
MTRHDTTGAPLDRLPVVDRLDVERAALDAYSVVWEPSRRLVLDHQRALKAAINAALEAHEVHKPHWTVGDKAGWRGREVQVLAVDQVVIEDLGTALTRDADELDELPAESAGGVR